MAPVPSELLGFETTYRVDWLYPGQPKLDAAAIRSELQRRLPKSQVRELGVGYLAVVHEGHRAEFAGKTGPAITAVFTAKDQAIPELELESALEQTWSWPRDEARARVLRSQTRVVQLDLLSRNQPYQTRLRLIHEVAKAVARVTEPTVAYWHPAGWMVAPEGLNDDPLDAAMNVRLFNVDGRASEHVMDTLGLAALGVPDIQCKFVGLEPARVAGFLRDTGRYVFENGDVIQEGNTIQGLEPSDKWACRRTIALVAPARAVVDVDPGPQHSTRSSNAGPN
jgi:hypothetical protein